MRIVREVLVSFRGNNEEDIMPRQINVCQHVDFSPCISGNQGPPVCDLGHIWCSDCLKENYCRDYESSIGLTFEEVKAKYRLDESFK